jgi:hypothetical protein
MTMKRIAYAEEWLTTDDRVADLVLEYARALARHDTADTVTIPVVEEDGTLRHAQILIGPASQIIVIESDQEGSLSPEVDAAVADLEARVQRLVPQPVLFDEGGDEPTALADY